MIHLTYAPELIEEAVLMAERNAPSEALRAFRRERNRVYEIADADQREAGFRSLHQKWFLRLGLHLIVEEIVGERVDVAVRVADGRVLPAMTRSEEGADLIDQVMPGSADRRPLLVLQIGRASCRERG